MTTAHERRLIRERMHLEHERVEMRASSPFRYAKEQLSLLVGLDKADEFVASVEARGAVCSVLDLNAAIWHAKRGEPIV